jgi:hypothetical protein
LRNRSSTYCNVILTLIAKETNFKKNDKLKTKSGSHPGLLELSISFKKYQFYLVTHSLLQINLKGHGNEADFLGVLQELGPHRSLTLPFEPFRFWLRIPGDIRNRKTTP